MKKPRFSEQQIAVALRQAEQGTPAVEVCRKLGVSEATVYAWKKRYVGMGVAELRRVRQLEDENRRLKQVVADLTLDKQMLQEVLQKRSEARPPARDRARPVRGVSRERAAGLWTGRLPPGDVLLPRQAPGSGAAADAAARAGGGATAVRVSTAVYPASAGGVARESQADLPTVRRGAAGGANTTAKEAGEPSAGGTTPTHAAE